MRVMAHVLIVASLVFLVVGPGRDAWRWWRLRSWVPVVGDVRRVWIETAQSAQGVSSNLSRSRKLTVTRAVADYSYSYNGKTHPGRQVTSFDVRDSFEDQQEIADELQRQVVAKSPMTVWVNPARPEEAVLLRIFRWKPFVAKLGLGLALLLSALVMRRARL